MKGDRLVLSVDSFGKLPGWRSNRGDGADPAGGWSIGLFGHRVGLYPGRDGSDRGRGPPRRDDGGGGGGRVGVGGVTARRGGRQIGDRPRCSDPPRGGPHDPRPVGRRTSMSGRRIRRGARMVLTVSILVSTLASPAWAHPHTVDADGDGVAEATLANGQNHGPFQAGKSCGGDPAAYGLESAHHGPDAGTPGKADDD